MERLMKISAAVILYDVLKTEDWKWNGFDNGRNVFSFVKGWIDLLTQESNNQLILWSVA